MVIPTPPFSHPFKQLLFSEFLKHVKADDRKWERACWLRLFTPFKNKKFGPKFTVQFVSCLEVLSKVMEPEPKQLIDQRHE